MKRWLFFTVATLFLILHLLLLGCQPKIEPSSPMTPPSPAPVPVPTPVPSPKPALVPTPQPLPSPAQPSPPAPLPQEPNIEKTEIPETGPGECGSTLVFSVSPLDIENITGIVPLGNLNPPSHTFPTDHIYFYITRQQGADRPDITTLYSPGDLTITSVSASEHVNAGFMDYNVFLKPCEDITVMFYHASSLSEAVFGDTSPSAGWRPTASGVKNTTSK